MLPTVQKKFKKSKKRLKRNFKGSKRNLAKAFKKVKIFYRKNPYASLGILTGLFLLLSSLIILASSTIQPNDEIHFLKTSNKAILQNKNPTFNTSFGQRDEPEKQWTRFEAKAVKENPFEEKEKDIFTQLIDFVSPKKTLGIELSLESVGERKVRTSTELVQVREVKKEDETYTPFEKQTVLNPDVVDGVDIEYQILEGMGLKEDIIIKDLEEYTKGCEDVLDCDVNLNEFVFDITLDSGLELRSAWYTHEGKSTENYYFTDSRGNYVAHFLPSWAIDNKGIKTHDVDIKVIDDNEDDLKILVVVDREWLFSEERVYPIRIDPTIVHDTQLEFDEGAYINTEYVTGKGVAMKDMPVCTGGTITQSGDYTIHTFTSSGTFGCDKRVMGDVLVVGGGGGGAATGSGGGAGGYIYKINFLVESGNTSVTVGTGGAGGLPNANPGTKGGNSIFSSLTAEGGGYGVSHGGSAGGDGGSGGGGPIRTATPIAPGGTASQGYPGGDGYVESSWVGNSGGGGGAGSAGNAGGNSPTTAKGGDGLANSISGSSVYYAGGGGGGEVHGSYVGAGGLGGGGSAVLNNAGGNGVANTGGGGAGGSYYTASPNYYAGGNGGTGVVIIRYKPEIDSGDYTSPSIDFGTNSNIESISWDSEGVNTGDGETPYDTTGLIAQWNFNETSGTTAVSGESCGTSCNGTLTNFANTTGQDVAIGSGWTNTHRRWGTGALMFDGVDDNVVVTDKESLRLISGGSISAWVYQTSFTPSTAPRILDKSIDTSGTNGFLFAVLGSTRTLAFRVNAGTQTESIENAIRLNKWEHVVVTFDNSGRKLYVNGVDVTSTAGDQTALPPNLSGSIAIGNRANNTDRPFPGIIDNVQIYNRALTPSEILSNYQAGNIEFQYRTSNDGSTWGNWEGGSEVVIDSLDDQYLYNTTDTGLVSYWPMDETSGSTVNDVAGINNGTATGTTVVDGKHNKGKAFNGSSDYITLPSGFSDFTTGFTVELWAKPTSNASYARFIDFGEASGTGNRNILLARVGTTNDLGLWSGDGTTFTSITATGGIINNEWHHYAGTIDASGMGRIYRDGKLLTSGQLVVPQNASRTYNYIGKSNWADPLFKGQIDSVRIYNTALSSSQVHEQWLKGSSNPNTLRTSSIDNSIVGNRSLEVDSAGNNIDGNTVGYWKLDESGGTGAYLKDYSGNSNHGTPTGTTFVKDGKVGGARSFNGSSDYIAVSSPSNIPIGNSTYTIEAWINPSVTGTRGIVGWGNYGTTNEVNALRINGTNQITNYWWGMDLTVTVGTININTWYHVVANFDGTTRRIYWNGTLVGSDTPTGHNVPNASNFTIGTTNTNEYFGGSIDDIRISSVARTPEEIYESYRMGRDHRVSKTLDSSINLNNYSKIPFWIASDTLGSNLELTYGNSKYANYEPDSNTVGLWRMEEDWGPIFDSSGNGNHGLVNPNSFLYTRYNNLCTSVHPANHTELINCFDNSTLLHKSIQSTSQSPINIGDYYTSMYSTWMYVKNPGTWTFAIDGDDAVEIEVSGSVVAGYYGGHGFCNCYTYSGTVNLGRGWHKINIRHEEIAGGDGVVAHFIPPGGASWAVLNASNLSGHGTVHAYLMEDTEIQNSDYITNGIPRPARPYIDGKRGKGRSFNGSSDQIVIDSNFGLGTTNSTLEAWVYLETLSESGPIIKVGGDGTYGYGIGVGNDNWDPTSLGNNLVMLFEGIRWISTDVPIGLGWHHVAMRLDGSGYPSAYLDGKLVYSDTTGAPTSPSSSSTIIGGYTHGISRYLDCSIDEVRISNTARTPSEIRQAYEVGRRSYPITVNFKANLLASNLITGSTDLSFTIDETPYGTTDTIENIDREEKIIVKENYDGTEYIAQGNISTINKSTGATTVESWDTGSTFPGGGFSVNATVFKWQKEYFDTRYPLTEDKNAVSELTFRKTTDVPATFWIDDIKKAKYLDDDTGATFTKVEDVQYVQYKPIFSTWDSSISPDFYMTSVSTQYNRPPLAPTSLLTEGQTNPGSISTGTPAFSAIYNDDDTTDTADAYYIEVNTQSDFLGTTMWDSGWTAMTSTAVGVRSPDITYAGSPLSYEGTTYYWRIKFKDNYEAESPWSTTANFTMNDNPTAPTGLLTEGQTNPGSISTGTPTFSAIFNDPNTGDTSGYYEIEVNTQADFLGTVMWDSGKSVMASTTEGTRSPNITYAGSPLTYQGTTYYWRIRFWDSVDNEGAWSSTANFTMNDNPTAPTGLLTEAQTNPINVSTLTPAFSAIFNDPDTGDTGKYYEINVNTQLDFLGTSMWNTGKTATTSITNGLRSPNYTYNGTALYFDASKYYWRIRFWDSVDNQGAWSSTANFTMIQYYPNAPSGLLVEGETNPQKMGNEAPKFSAIFNHAYSEEFSSYYQLQVNTSSAFTGTIMWDSTKSSMSSVKTGARCADIRYGGSNLNMDDTTYYWRIKFWDSLNEESSWSETANFTTTLPYMLLDGLRLDGIRID